MTDATAMQWLGFGLLLYMVGWAVEFVSVWHAFHQMAEQDCACLPSEFHMMTAHADSSPVVLVSLVAFISASWPARVTYQLATVLRARKSPKCDNCGRGL